MEKARTLSHRALLVVVLGAVAAPHAAATDWYVDASYGNCPGSDGSATKPFCTIGAALAAASAGDTIHLAQGTYGEQVALSFDITIVGTNGAAGTILDPTGSGGIVWVNPGLSVGLIGLTLRAGDADEGAGVHADSATVVIEDCVVFDCGASGRAQSDGGGIFARNCDLTLERTTLSSNEAEFYGGAIYASGGTVKLVDCALDTNSATYGMAILAADGAAIELTRTSVVDHDPPSSNGAAVVLWRSSRATVTGSTFERNKGEGSGGAIEVDATSSLKVADSSFAENRAVEGGAIRSRGAGAAIDRCRFVGNRAVASSYSATGVGGAVHGDSITLRDCLFDGNEAEPSIAWGYAIAGAAFLYGSTSIERCVFVANRVGGIYESAIGGAIAFSSGSATLRDCEIARNVAESTSAGVAGTGAGIALFSSASATLERCTLGGNEAMGPGAITKGGSGGGISVEGGSTVSLSHTIVAGNTATTGPDVWGAATTADYNLVGDTSGCLLGGSGPNDLLDADPLFVDPANGDFSLAPTSPCLDSGDPALQPSGADVAGHPRLLDGTLDRVMELDRGAREFDHVELAVSGAAIPGGTLTLDTSGTPGMAVLLIVGLGQAELRVRPFGALFVDLLQSFVILPWGTIPSSVDVDLAPSFPAPLALFAQEAAIAASSGNFSRLVRIDVE